MKEARDVQEFVGPNPLGKSPDPRSRIISSMWLTLVSPLTISLVEGREILPRSFPVLISSSRASSQASQESSENLGSRIKVSFPNTT